MSVVGSGTPTWFACTISNQTEPLPAADALQFRGVLEWGFRAADVLELLREAEAPRRTSPFHDLCSMRGAVWLEPSLRGEVSYAEIVGGRLRAPELAGLVIR